MNGLRWHIYTVMFSVIMFVMAGLFFVNGIANNNKQSDRINKMVLIIENIKRENNELLDRNKELEMMIESNY